MEWRKIPGFANYSASSEGTIRRDVRLHRSEPGPVSLSLNDRGYWKCSATDDRGRHRTVTVHTLVALAFLGERPAGLWVCHNDGDAKNCRPENLRYDTPASNTADTRRQERTPVGTRAHNAKLTEASIPEILALWESGMLTQKEIGDRFGVSQRAIWQVLHGLKWKHVERRSSPLTLRAA